MLRINFDKSGLERGFQRLLRSKFPEARHAGVVAALGALESDVVSIAPTPAVRTGAMIGSVGTRVEDASTGLLYVSVPYAAKQHELPVNTNYRHPGTAGPKFVESKLLRFARDYGKIFADTFKRTLQG